VPRINSPTHSAPQEGVTVNLDNVRRDDWVVGGLALLLVLDLLILAWFSFGGTVTVGSTSISFGGSLTATDAPDGWLGVLAVIALVYFAMQARNAATRVAPRPAGPPTPTGPAGPPGSSGPPAV